MGNQLFGLVNWTLVSAVVDILLVAWLIYHILLFVRGTRALPMLAGLGVVVFVYLVSRKLSLVTLNFILGEFLGSVILVIVVLFQDDLRRALIKVGLIPGFGTDTLNASDIAIGEVAKAAGELSAKRVGALIVIKRDVGLEDHTERAVKIDAIVSHQLLISVFLPQSPIHDGAVVIDGDRIVAAGAVLPLTFNPEISHSYGTRHRAGIGLTEHTDAVVVVVSEETGSISVVREGRLTTDLDSKSLYNALHRLIVLRQQRRQRKKRTRFLRKAAAKSEAAETSDGEPGSKADSEHV